MEIKDMMTSEVFSVEPHVSIAEASLLMRDKDIGSLPVIENDKLLGILTDRDVVTRAASQGKDLQSTPVQQIMSSEVITCKEEESTEQAASKMSKHQIRRLPIVNDAYKVSGIVSLGDLSVRGSAESAGDALNKISQPN